MNSRKITRRPIRSSYQMKNKFYQNRIPRKFNSRFNRPNRRLFPKFRRNRNRLQRVQNIVNNKRNFNAPKTRNNNNYYSSNSNRYFNGNTNSKREIFVKGLPRFVDNKGLFNLFKNEGRIVKSNVLYDSIGFSRGIGKIEFADFRDAWKAINKWNNTSYKGFTLKLEYRKSRNEQNGNNRNNRNNGNNVNSGNSGNNGNTGNNVSTGDNATSNFGYNKNYGKTSNYRAINGYSRKYNQNRYNYNKYNSNGYSRYKY